MRRVLDMVPIAIAAAGLLAPTGCRDAPPETPGTTTEAPTEAPPPTTGKPVMPSAEGDESAPSGSEPAPPCDPEVVRFELPAGDVDHHSLEMTLEGGFAYRLESPTEGRWEVLVTGSGRHDDLARNVGGLLVGERVLRITEPDGPGGGQAVAIDDRVDRTWSDVWYPRLYPDGTWAYMARDDEGARLVVDGEPFGDVHEGIDYPERLDDGSWIYIAKDDGRARLVRHDGERVTFGPDFEKVGGVRTHGARVAYVGIEGRARTPVVDDRAASLTCRDAITLGFTGDHALFACRRDEAGWALTRIADGAVTIVVDGLEHAPWVPAVAAPEWGVLVDGLAVADGTMLVDGERVELGTHIRQLTLSPPDAPGPRRAYAIYERDATFVSIIDLDTAQRGEETQVLDFGMARDRKLAHDWAVWSDDGRHVGHSLGVGRVMVDGALVKRKDIEDVVGFGSSGVPVFVGPAGLWAGERALVALDVVAAVEVDGESDLVRYAGRRGRTLVHGCARIAE